ncbi:MAG: S9 family peptidase [Bacteroides sp.]|nr:S9 family peptidase [Roseburia sp.]MCM1346693.1 S9 family peptidase [Bacteroides sp.]MCM1419947.1 S9 family peptidase [Bacteroides sp.]
MKRIILSAVVTLTTAATFAQGTVEDYKRAFAIRGKYSNKMIHGNVDAHAIAGTQKFWYSDRDTEGTIYTVVDAKNNTKENLFDTGKLADALKSQTGKEFNRHYLGLGRMRVDKENKLYFNYGRHNWVYDITQNTLQKGDTIIDAPYHHWMEVPEEKDGVIASPDRKQEIFFKDNNLYLRNTETKAESPLTNDGVETNYYSSYGSWSADGKYFATVKIKPAPKRYVYMVESSPTDQLQPKLHKQEYPKPGDSLNYRVPVIIETATGKVTEPSTELFASQYYVTSPRWDKNNKTATFEFNERGHKHYRVLELSAETGKVRTIIEEKSDKYINYSRQFRHDFADGKRILWMSERDNYCHLYLYNRETGKVINQVTKGEFYVRNIQKVDEKNGIVYFSANGMNKNEDPYLIHYYKVGLNGKGLKCLTPEEGNHKAVYTDDMAYLIDTYSTVLKAPVTVLRSAKDGKIIRTLETADISRLEAEGWKAPEVFVAKGRDGQTDMWGLIQRPSNFDPNKKYPVIEYIYSGPGDQYVPKSFTPWLWNLADLAELGFIVVQLDAMTTSFRSKSFEEVCYKNLKDAGFPDRIAWIKAAAEKYPYMDLERMGIYGCSAGGQEALGALLFHGDFYKAGYAACGCHDNRMDKIWWNEQWMGYPIDESYSASSNVDNAKNLQGKLMIVVGELDDNVDPASTMQVVNALIKAGKDFELVVVPGAHHTMGESFGEHKRYDFFVKNLLNVNPPAWNEVK